MDIEIGSLKKRIDHSRGVYLSAVKLSRLIKNSSEEAAILDDDLGILRDDLKESIDSLKIYLTKFINRYKDVIFFLIWSIVELLPAQGRLQNIFSDSKKEFGNLENLILYGKGKFKAKPGLSSAERERIIDAWKELGVEFDSTDSNEGDESFRLVIKEYQEDNQNQKEKEDGSSS